MSTLPRQVKTGGSIAWHELILASAGSGKTFTLATRFIRLLADGAPVEQILASTFTRKAAGEISERILRMLAGAATDEKQRTLLEKEAGRKLSRERCLHLLEELASKLHRLSVSTLDSFFARVVGSFALELGFPPDWRIVDEVTDAQLRGEAVHAMLRGADPQQIVTLIRRIDRGSANLSVHQRLMSIVKDYHAVYRLTLLEGEAEAERAWHPYRDPGPGETVNPELDEAMQRLAQVDVPVTGKGQPDATWHKALQTLQQCGRTRNWFDLVDCSLVAKVLAGEANFNRRPIPDALRETVMAFVACARPRIMHALLAQLDAVWQVLRLYDAEYRRLKRATRCFGFDDMTLALAGEGGAEALAARQDIYYRLDAKVGHVLLDEFQDTSLPQWTSLEPIVDEVLANREDRAALIVADPKQSIYGWRGGEPSLVAALGARYEMSGPKLSRSWRSSQVVLDAVNGVFENLEQNAAITEPWDQRTAAQWRGSFTRHEAAKKLPGHVRIAVADDADTQLQRAAELVKEVADAAPGCDVGVLVCTNKAVAEIIDILRRRLGVAASEEGGNPLTDSPAVVAVLSLLRMADHPGDLISRFHVATSPLGPVVEFTEFNNDRAARAAAHRVRRQLITEGYGPTLHEWTRQLAPSCDDRDLSRLLQLVELGWAHEAEATVRPGGFVQLVEATKVEDPSAARVRVMTVHQAKGLEFDIVVLAELDRTLGSCGAGDLMIYRSDPIGPVERVMPYIGECVRGVLPELQPLWEQHRARRLTDDLGVLYVAMTRARYALHAVIKPTSDSEAKNGPSLTAGNLLRYALADGALAAPGDDAYYQTEGTADWYARLDDDLKRFVELREEHLPTDLLAPTAGRRRILPRRSPSQEEGGPSVDIAQLMRLDTASARLRGSAFHALCEQVEWLDDPAPDDAALEAAVRAAAPLADPTECIAQWKRMLDNPQIVACLRRSAYPPGAALTVLREEEFVIAEEQGLLTGVIDRLVLVKQGERVIAADIIDFKTDHVEGPQVEERIAHYRPQISAYKRAVAKMYALPEKAITARLLFTTAGRAVTL